MLVDLLMARSLILVAVSAKVSTMLAVPCTAMTIEAHWRYDIRGNRNSVTRYNAKTYSKVSYELTLHERIV